MSSDRSSDRERKRRRRRRRRRRRDVDASSSSSSSGHRRSVIDVVPSVPFQLCFEFLSLERVLAARASCRVMAEAAEACSPELCFSFLERHLRKHNAHFRGGEDAMRVFLTPRSDGDNDGDGDGLPARTSFEQLMRCCRVLGACLPTDVVADDRSDSCCPVRPPPYLTTNRGLSITDAYPKCPVLDRCGATDDPPLFPGVVCPFCRKETLRLNISRYLTSSSASKYALLTFTPDGEDDGEEGNFDSDSNPRMVLKHVLRVFCSSCQTFGLFKPAAPCSAERCDWETPNNPDDLYQRTWYVTAKCVNEDCHRPAVCQSCTGKLCDPNYDDDGGGRDGIGPPSFQYIYLNKRRKASACASCYGRFCVDCALSDELCGVCEKNRTRSRLDSNHKTSTKKDTKRRRTVASERDVAGVVSAEPRRVQGCYFGSDEDDDDHDRDDDGDDDGVESEIDHEEFTCQDELEDEENRDWDYYD